MSSGRLKRRWFVVASIAIVFGLFVGSVLLANGKRHGEVVHAHVTKSNLTMSRPVPSKALHGAYSFSCPNSSTCIGSSAVRWPGESYLHPTGEARMWTARRTPNGGLSATNDGTVNALVHQITCITVRRCFAISWWHPDLTAGQADLALLRTTDGARTWSSVPLPPDVTSLGGISCLSTSSCVVTGSTGNDGQGKVWVLRGNRFIARFSAPSNAAIGDAVSCATEALCVTEESLSNNQGNLLVSHDGGWHWTIVEVAKLWMPSDIDCSTASFCITAGNGSTSTGAVPDQQRTGAFTWTSDAGSTWNTVFLPPHSGLTTGDVECNQALRCIASVATAASDTWGGALLVANGGNVAQWTETLVPRSMYQAGFDCSSSCLFISGGRYSALG